MSRKITEIFNDYYRLYLNKNINTQNDITNFIDLYIKKNLDELFGENLDWIISDISQNIPNYNIKFCKYTIRFNDEIISFLYLNKFINTNKLFDLFIYYLGIIIYNTNLNNNTNLYNNTNLNNNIFNILNDGIIICDHKFEILFNNTSSKIIINKLVSQKFKDNIKNIYDIFHQLRDILKPNEIFKNRKINYKCEYNNSEIDLLINVNTIVDNLILYNVIIITNLLTENKISNDSFISHELRNPLQSISFSNHLLQIKNKDDNLKKYLNIINKSVYDMTKIINDILDIDRIDSNKLNIQIENIVIRDLIDRINFEFLSYINSSNINFKIIINDNIPNTLLTDSTRTKQIIMNLLINALKYSKSNIQNNIILEVIYDELTKCIEFNIIDNGIGIKEQEINKIFEKKYNNITTNNSNGLGLYICNKISNLLGGYIKIDTKYMHYSKFTFIHPINLDNTNLILQKNIENLNINGNIMICDNDTNITLLFNDILNNIKYKYNLTDFIFTTCNDKNNIYDLIELTNYSMLFIDIIDINDINDMNIIKILRRKKYNGKIIVMTQNINIKLDPIFYDGILIKPFNENDVLDKIKLI
jgi:signal transduction histidine kinase